MANEEKRATEKILVFEPHPDDVAFQIAGSVRKWILEGREVMICTVTTGNNSTFEMSVSADRIKEVMMREHAVAMKILGIDGKHLVQWGYDDLGLDPGRDRDALLRDMIKLIRTFRPMTVVTMDPRNMLNEENPDHRAVAMTGFEAAAHAAVPNLYREQYGQAGVEQHFVSRVLLYMSPEPDTFVDIAGEPIETRIKLGFTYDSQLDLLITEANRRLEGMGVDFPLFKMPKEHLWPMVCEQIAEGFAQDCRKMYPERKDIKLAEAFRLQYLGVVEKVRNFLPKELQMAEIERGENSLMRA